MVLRKHAIFGFAHNLGWMYGEIKDRVIIFWDSYATCLLWSGCLLWAGCVLLAISVIWAVCLIWWFQGHMPFNWRWIYEGAKDRVTIFLDSDANCVFWAGCVLYFGCVLWAVSVNWAVCFLWWFQGHTPFWFSPQLKLNVWRYKGQCHNFFKIPMPHVCSGPVVSSGPLV